MNTFHKVVEDGDLETAKALLRDDPTLANSKDYKWETPLVNVPNKAMAELLLSAGADLNAESCVGGTALHEAAKSGYLDVSELLILRGVDVNARDMGGTTALHWAAAGGHLDLAALLLANGAGLDTKDRDGYSPLREAGRWGHVDLVELLLSQGANINETGADQAKIVELLRRRGRSRHSAKADSGPGATTKLIRRLFGRGPQR